MRRCQQDAIHVQQGLNPLWGFLVQELPFCLRKSKIVVTVVASDAALGDFFQLRVLRRRANYERRKKIFGQEVAPKVHPRRRPELDGAADRLFARMDDTIREAARMAAGRNLTAERLAETSQAGLKEIFTRR